MTFFMIRNGITKTTNEDKRTVSPVSFGDIAKSFNLPEDQVPIFEKYVNLTSKLIKRPYYQTFKLVEGWQIHTIIRRYNECMNYKGEIPKDILWWSLRRKELDEEKKLN